MIMGGRMTFEEWWGKQTNLMALDIGDRFISEGAWQAAQEALKKQLDDELTAAFMLGYEAAKNDYGMGKDA
jgi:hypothetical protein